jgi:hypothetical protein
VGEGAGDLSQHHARVQGKHLCRVSMGVKDGGCGAGLRRWSASPHLPAQPGI